MPLSAVGSNRDVIESSGLAGSCSIDCDCPSATGELCRDCICWEVGVLIGEVISVGVPIIEEWSIGEFDTC